MIAELKPYLAYKDSGVPWFGAVPEPWEVRRLRNVAQMLVSNVDKHTKDGEIPVRLCNYVDVYKNDRITDRLPFMRATVSREEIERFRLQVGDVIITKDSESWTDIGVPALVEYAAPDLVCGYHLAIVRPRTGIALGAYLLRAMQSLGVASQFHGSANGVTRYGLTHNAIRSVVFPLPPFPDQAAIVCFLDHADRRIRRYIRAKQKLIKLLEEQKQAIIHRAVTRGLNPNVRLKPSGVEWLGDVPEHWKVKRLKWVTRLQRGYDLPDDRRIPGPFPVVSSGGIIGTHCEAKAMGPGVVMGRYGSTDAVFFIETDFWPHNTSLFVTDFQGNLPRWSYFMLRTISKADHSGKSAVPGVDRKDLFDINVVVPPPHEQEAIVGWIISVSVGLEGAIDAAQREISLLREYRTRLIADVVTGKLDVRGMELPRVEEREAERGWDEPEDTEGLENAQSEDDGADPAIGAATVDG